MKTAEEIKKQIEEFEKEIFQFYANLAEYFSDAKTTDDIKEKDISYYKDADNIKKLMHIDEATEMGLTDLDNFTDYPPFLYTAIQYKNKKAVYFIDLYKLGEDYGWDQQKLLEKEFYDLKDKISLLKDILDKNNN